MKSLLLTLLLFSINFLSIAQDLNVSWAAQFGITRGDSSYELIKDDNYIGGVFRNTVDFDPGTRVFNLTSNGVWDIFVLKLNPKGELLWAKSFGGKGIYYLEIREERIRKKMVVY